MRRLLALAAILAAFVPAAALADYWVYCASGRIEIDQRTPDEMRSQRSACAMSQGFSSRSDAEGFARRNFGGVGGSCSCR